jgi:hypothetical protein
MAEITVREIDNEDFVQHAEVRIPVDNPEEVRQALAVIARLRKRALDHLQVDDNDEDGAEKDYVAVDYKKLDGDVAVVEVMMVAL